MSAVYGWGMACGHIKDFGQLPFPHKKICIQGLQGRHALSMLGRTLVSNRLLLDNMTQYIEIVLLLYSIYYREAFKRENYHKFHSLSATHKNFLQEILAASHTHLCDCFSKYSLPYPQQFSPSKVSDYIMVLCIRFPSP